MADVKQWRLANGRNINNGHHAQFSFNHACQFAPFFLSLPSPPLSLPLYPLVAVMARSILSVFVAIASASYVVSQTPTFPSTPLASLNIPYNAIVCHVFFGFSVSPPEFVFSLSKSRPKLLFAGLKSGTISAIQPPRTRILSVRLRLSIILRVRYS